MPPAAPTLLDALLPRWDCNEVHTRQIAAPPETAWRAMHEMRMGEARLVAPLMALRGLPARLLGRHAVSVSGGGLPALAAMQRGGFVKLAESPPEGQEPGEVVLGVIGRFWSVTRNTPVPIADRAAFERFAEPGYVRAALNFRMEPAPGGTRVVTETRILGTDAASSRKFRLYWLVIRLGSGAIRRSWLAAIARRAERA